MATLPVIIVLEKKKVGDKLSIFSIGKFVIFPLCKTDCPVIYIAFLFLCVCIDLNINNKWFL